LCTKCWKWGTYPDNAVLIGGQNFWSAEWQPSTGKWAFKSYNDKYLARCRGCVGGGIYPDFAFVYEKNSSNAIAQFSLIPQ
jgi:hypothetical protein